MPKHKTKLIINPNADLGNAWRRTSDLRPIVEAHGGADWTGTVYPTHAVELAREAAEEGYELVVAVGGDGTVHEVINGLMQVPVERRPRLGVVPMGSGNDFAHAIGMDHKPPVALTKTLTGQPKSIDIGVMEDNLGRREYFDNTINIGFGGAVTIYSHQMPVVRGFLMYLFAVIQTILLKHDVIHLQITADGKSWEEDVMMFILCNGGREGGGFNVSPSARNDDGIFNYLSVEACSRPMMFRLIPEFMGGTHERFRQITTGQFHKIELQADRPLLMHADGEIFAGFGTDVNHLKIEIIPNALEVMTGND